MKTREEFTLLADEYRLETRRRSLLYLPFMALVFLTGLALVILILPLLGLHAPLVTVWMILFFSMQVVFGLYRVKSQESLARKLELVCPTCSRVAPTVASKRATVTQNCPHCGGPLFS